WSSGYVWWSAAIPLMAGGVPMAMIGAWLNARTRAKILQRIFGAVLFLLAIRILFS
ncbi:MAG: TSUP family transporter, partial [Candidatus Latescibacterota bacterium]